VLGTERPFQIISGYRSPKTNAYLRKRGGGVAKKSSHMQGKAVDIRVEGIDSKVIRSAALSLGRGGVGHYPRSNLFRQSKRDLSHGCIRVENPSALALFALSNNPGWTKQKIAEAMYSDTPSIVNLKQKIPVLIFYSTALVTQSGVSFYPDIYAHINIIVIRKHKLNMT
jgi:hypothetical protein